MAVRRDGVARSPSGFLSQGQHLESHRFCEKIKSQKSLKRKYVVGFLPTCRKAGEGRERFHRKLLGLRRVCLRLRHLCLVFETDNINIEWYLHLIII